MRIHHLKNAITVLTALAAFFGVLRPSHSCERPEFIKNNLALTEISETKLRIEWTPVNNARHYEVKYILRIPEGRTLVQGEGTSDQPFYVLSRTELSAEQFLHLIVEVAAHCDSGKSASGFAQIALRNAESDCLLDKKNIQLKNGELFWAPVKSAQTYMMCSFKKNSLAVCQETASVQNKIDLNETHLVSVTPICKGGRSAPAFLSVENRLVNK